MAEDKGQSRFRTLWILKTEIDNLRGQNDAAIRQRHCFVKTQIGENVELRQHTDGFIRNAEEPSKDFVYTFILRGIVDEFMVFEPKMNAPLRLLGIGNLGKNSDLDENGRCYEDKNGLSHRHILKINTYAFYRILDGKAKGVTLHIKKMACKSTYGKTTGHFLHYRYFVAHFSNFSGWYSSKNERFAASTADLYSGQVVWKKSLIFAKDSSNAFSACSTAAICDGPGASKDERK